MTVAHRTASGGYQTGKTKLPEAARVQPSGDPAPQRRFPSLDGIRGLAVMGVFMLHYTQDVKSSSAAGHAILAIFKAGWMGVDFFFVLSGFLITRILLDSRDSPGYLLNFWARRALRLFPLMYGLAVIFLLLTPVLHIHWRLGHGGYLLYLANVVASIDPALNRPSPHVYLFHLWSLSVEEQFYIAWPLAILFIRQRKTLLLTSIVICALALMVRLLGRLTGAVDPWFLYMQTVCRMDSLGAGAILAILWQSSAFSSAASLIVKRWFFAASLALVVCIAAYDKSFLWQVPLMETVGFSAVAALASAVILLALDAGSMTSRIMSSFPLRMCGRYSYGLYLFHIFLKPALEPLLPKLESCLGSGSMAGISYVLVSFGACMLVSVLSFELFEKRVMRLKRHFGGLPTPASDNGGAAAAQRASGQAFAPGAESCTGI